MRRNNRYGRRAYKKVYSIIVDGETEKWYFEMMKNHEELANIAIKPDLPTRKKLNDQYEMVKDHARYYDKVIWLVDFDTIIKESKETKKESSSASLLIFRVLFLFC